MCANGEKKATDGHAGCGEATAGKSVGECDASWLVSENRLTVQPHAVAVGDDLVR